MNDGAHHTNTADREILIERVLDAPPDLAFAAWTDPKHIVEWWGPNGFTTSIERMEVRPGGSWRFVMHGPDGVDYPNLVTFHEVVHAERLVYSHGDDADPEQFRVTVTFVPQGAKTLLTMRMVFPSAAARDQVIREFGALDGARQTLDRLEQHLRKIR